MTDVVLDPFAGRGTTLYAARLSGLRCYGIDANPVAVAIAESKLANTSSGHVVRAARTILAKSGNVEIPQERFWRLAFSSQVLIDLCRLRSELLINCESPARKALRAIVLGALHGPLQKSTPSYFSNQCPRTYAPKPGYAVRFWIAQGLKPPAVNTLDLVARRAARYFDNETTIGRGLVVHGDSREATSFEDLERKVNWIVTSPPYYGMRTYVPDQWLRRWFLGGPPIVDYSMEGQLSHFSLPEFAGGLRRVWMNCSSVAMEDCRMVIRFGAINDRKIDSLELLSESFRGTNWRIQTWKKAGTAENGRRQANSFVPARAALAEHDVWAIHRLT